MTSTFTLPLFVMVLSLVNVRCIAFSPFPRGAYISIRLSRGNFASLVAAKHARIRKSSNRLLMAPCVNFLQQVEATVEKILSSNSLNITHVPTRDREAVGIALHLDQRLSALRRNNDCPYCWMQRTHCVCQNCPTVDDEVLRNGNNQVVNRIFVLMHHKEIALKVDTAKLILTSFPNQCRLVVGGIGPEYQDSMREMLVAIEESNSSSCEARRRRKCVVLFPDETSKPFDEILLEEKRKLTIGAAKNRLAGAAAVGDQDVSDEANETTFMWDVVVIDGTWTQARRLHTRYLPSEVEGGPRRVRLSDKAVEKLGQSSEMTTTDEAYISSSEGHNSGHQLRRHVVTWRQVSTFEATRLFLKDILDPEEPSKGGSSRDSAESPLLTLPWEQLQSYHVVANEAARRELGPKREKISVLRRQ